MIYYKILKIIKNYLSKTKYELINFKKKRGLLKIFVDFPLIKNKKNITINDCEKISNQLKHIFYIEKINFNFLEISSPGINRILKKKSDYMYFINHEVILKFKTPPIKFKNKKSFQGILLKTNDKKFKLKLKYKKNSEKILKFNLEDIYKANLITKINFKNNKNILNKCHIK